MNRRSRLVQLTAALLTFAFALNAGGATLAICGAMSPGGSAMNHSGMTQSDHHASQTDATRRVLSSPDRSADTAICHQVLMCGNASVSLNREPLSVAILLVDAPIPSRTNALQPRSIHPEPPQPKA